MITARLNSPGLVLPRFLREVYAPGLHLAYAAAWFVALQSILCQVAGLQWRPDGLSLVGIATLFLVLFYLRVADEWKDLDYDRVHNPDRPLVRGLVSLRDVRRYLAVTAVLVLALNAAWGGAWALGVAAVDMAWGLLLVVLERRWHALREGMLLNLLFTYPVNVALSVYAYALWLGQAGGRPTWQGAAALLSFALAFLVYEFLRKTAWPSVARPGERLYSQALGPWGAILALVCCALGATLLLFALLLGAGWDLSWAAGASLPALLPVIQALTRFLTRRDQRVRLAGQGMAFLLLFYGLPCLLALASGSGLNVPGSPVAGLR